MAYRFTDDLMRADLGVGNEIVNTGGGFMFCWIKRGSTVDTGDAPLALGQDTAGSDWYIRTSTTTSNWIFTANNFTNSSEYDPSALNTDVWKPLLGYVVDNGGGDYDWWVVYDGNVGTTSGTSANSTLRYMGIGAGVQSPTLVAPMADAAIAHAVFGDFAPTQTEINHLMWGGKPSDVFASRGTGDRWWYYPLTDNGDLADYGNQSGPSMSVIVGSPAYEADNPLLGPVLIEAHVKESGDPATSAGWPVFNNAPAQNDIVILGAGHRTSASQFVVQQSITPPIFYPPGAEENRWQYATSSTTAQNLGARGGIASAYFRSSGAEGTTYEIDHNHEPTTALQAFGAVIRYLPTDWVGCYKATQLFTNETVLSITTESLTGEFYIVACFAVRDAQTGNTFTWGGDFAEVEWEYGNTTWQNGNKTLIAGKRIARNNQTITVTLTLGTADSEGFGGTIYVFALDGEPAFPDTWSRKCPITIQSSLVAGSAAHTNMPVMLTEANFPSEMLDADGANAARTNGEDLRFTTDLAGTNVIPHEIVLFSLNNDPGLSKAIVWVKVPSVSHNTDTTIYVWYGNSTCRAIPKGSVNGAYDVWRDYDFVFHDGGYGEVDHSGKLAGGVTRTGCAQVTGPFGNSGGATGFGSTYGTTATDNVASRYLGLKDARGRTYQAWQFLGANTASYLWAQDTTVPSVWETLTQVAGTHLKYDPAYSTTPANWQAPFTLVDTTFRLMHLTYSDYSVASNDPVFYENASALTLSTDSNGVGTISNPIDPEFAGLIGNNADAANPWNGAIAEFRIRPSPLSADWISTEYNNQSSPSTFAIEGSPINANGPDITSVGGDDQMTVGETGQFIVGTGFGS